MLAPELLHRVLELIITRTFNMNYSTLYSASLVARKWRHPAQRLLGRNVVLASAKQAFAWNMRRGIENSTEAVESLLISSDCFKYEGIWDCCMGDEVRGRVWQCLKDLCLIDISPNIGDKDIESILTDLNVGPRKLRSLYVFGCTVTWQLAACPRLRQVVEGVHILGISDVTFPDWSTVGADVRAKGLRITQSCSSTLLSAANKASIFTLDLESFDPSDDGPFDDDFDFGLLDSLGPGLARLYLPLYPSSSFILPFLQECRVIRELHVPCPREDRDITWVLDNLPATVEILTLTAVPEPFDHILATIPTLEHLRELRISMAEESSGYGPLDAMRRRCSELGVEFFLLDLNEWER